MIEDEKSFKERRKINLVPVTIKKQYFTILKQIILTKDYNNYAIIDYRMGILESLNNNKKLIPCDKKRLLLKFYF